ncbi:DUF459 domain-containing protein [Pseudohoeflea suaedae]|uniref:DUF459 domain-containing protein n=1 Tax=Pseudohoeflea suaedae TaxID=877384 RepID=A0A4V3A6Y2_9HYPH|nr:DUF459 domain-containing protein [Pseudohoeflea suaedae]TDH35078.1 DUF459 domain-containing protein [Pseudohoeflea suaedae]
MSRPAVISFAARLTCLAALAFAIAVSGIPASHAQERIERKSLIEMLFGGNNGARQPNRREAAPQQNKSRRTSRPTKSVVRRAAPVAPAEPDVEKLENARKVLVVGDFLAGGLADGLEQSFEQSPGVVVIEQSSGSSGLVRDDYFDWPGELPGIIENTQPDIVVVQLGSNDSQQMKTDSGRAEVRSQAWLSEYEKRTDEIIRIVADSGKPLVWVGLPSFNFTSMSADMLALNGIFKQHVEQANGEFVDIWDGFVDEDGKFIFTGSDINGQQVRLRGSDGINVTKAGRRKMAFYVEKNIRRLLGSAAEPSAGVADLDDSNLPDLSFPTSPLETQNPTRTNPVALNDPDLDGGSELLGGTVTSVNLTPTPRDILVNQGIAPEAPVGRADNFAWPKSTPATVKPDEKVEADGAETVSAAPNSQSTAE